MLSAVTLKKLRRITLEGSRMTFFVPHIIVAAMALYTSWGVLKALRTGASGRWVGPPPTREGELRLYWTWVVIRSHGALFCWCLLLVMSVESIGSLVYKP